METLTPTVLNGLSTYTWATSANIAYKKVEVEENCVSKVPREEYPVWAPWMPEKTVFWAFFREGMIRFPVNLVPMRNEWRRELDIDDHSIVKYV